MSIIPFMVLVTAQDAHSGAEYLINPVWVPYFCFLAIPDCILWERNNFPKGNQGANLKGEMDTEQPQALQMSSTGLLGLQIVKMLRGLLIVVVVVIW